MDDVLKWAKVIRQRMRNVVLDQREAGIALQIGQPFGYTA